MSVGIRINNNSETRKVDIECCHDTTCPYCFGTGSWECPEPTFYLNVTNDNFRTLWNALGFDFDWCGEIDPRRVLNALRTFDQSLLLRNTEFQGVVYDCGLKPDRAARYCEQLTLICKEAEKREETIIWS